MASVFISSPAEVVVIDSRTKSGTITLPITNSIPYRVVTFKDQYGSFSNSTVTLSTQLGESFDDGTTTKIFNNSYGYASLYATSSKWMVMNATTTVQQTISSLTVNQLTFGTGAGWVQFGPLQASVVSSIQVNTNAGYINNLYLGNTSTATALQYWGLFGNYNNTVLAEVSTAGGVQELLVFKGSSASDRVRVQTTGNFVVETGVSARLWSNTTIPTLSNVTPAFIINTSSNVGIQTATPGATLDVAGTGRFQILSTLNINLSSINGQSFGGPINSTTIGLGTLGYVSTSQLISTTSNLVSQIQAAAASVTGSQLTSTTVGLGSLGYISSSQLLSTVGGLQTYISSFIDPAELASSVLSFISAGYFATQFTSTVTGLGTTGYISSSQLLSTNAGMVGTERGFFTSTVAGLGSSGYISSSQLLSTTAGLIEFPELQSTIQGLGSSGYISSSQLLSTTAGLIDLPELQSSIQGLGSSGYISSSQLLSTTAGLIDLPELQSTIQGLGSATYISSSQLVSTTAGILNSTGANLPTALLSTVTGLGSSGYISSSQLLSTTAGLIELPELQSSIQGLGSSGYISSSQLLSTTAGLIELPELQSSIQGLGSATYISSSQLLSSMIGVTATDGSNFASTVIGLGSSGYISTAQLLSTTGGLIDLPELQSSIQGLGSSGYISTAQLISTASGLIDLPELQSTVQGLGSAEYISSSQLLSTTLSYATAFQTLSAIITSLVATTGSISSLTVNELIFGDGNGWASFGAVQAVVLSSQQINTGQLYATSLSSQQVFISSINGSQLLGAEVLQSTVTGLGTSGYISTSQLVSTTEGILSQTGGNLPSALTSTTIGLGSLGYISSAQLVSTVGGLTTFVGVSISSFSTAFGPGGTNMTTITSTVEGLGSSGYISSLQLLSSMIGVTNTDGSNFRSTTIGLGSAGYISSAQLISTTGGLVDIPEILSTVQGLGSASYISSSQLISTTAGLLASGSGLTLPSLVSSVAGLGSIGYISTSQLVSTVAGLASQPAGSQSNISAFFVSAGFITASSVTTTFLFTSSVFFSSLSTSIINFGGGFGYLTMPDIYPNTVYTSTVTSSNVLVGWNSQLSPIQFFGFGTYSNTVISEVSTGGATQELVMFRGSNSSDRIRMQTTGSIVFEPGVSARLWPTVPSNVTPAMLINTSSNIGIQTASPTVPLDVAGAIRSVSFSTQQITTSSILGAPVFATGATFASSVTFRGPSTFFLGAISTSFLTGGPSQVYFPGPVGIGLTNPAFLLDVAGTGEFSTILTSSLTSWLTISTTQLGTSSVVANTSRTIVASSFQMGASTFTGKWNDAQYYVLQTI